MRAFIVELENRPGRLAELCEAVGQHGINIIGVAGTMLLDEGAIALITNDEAGTRSLLEERDATYREIDLVVASLEDRPGTLGEAARRLATREVNVELLVPTGVIGKRLTVAFGVDDPAGAREALAELAATGVSAI